MAAWPSSGAVAGARRAAIPRLTPPVTSRWAFIAAWARTTITGLPSRPSGAPVLVIHGSADLQPESVSRGFAARFANHRFVDIEGATHFVADEQPEVFAGAVHKFLGGL